MSPKNPFAERALLSRFRAESAKPDFWRELTAPALEFLRHETIASARRGHESLVTAAGVCALALFAALWYVSDASVPSWKAWTVLAVVVLGALVLMDRVAAAGVHTNLKLHSLLSPLSDPHRLKDVHKARQYEAARDFHDQVLQRNRELTYGDFMCMAHLALAEQDAGEQAVFAPNGLAA